MHPASFFAVLLLSISAAVVLRPVMAAPGERFNPLTSEQVQAIAAALPTKARATPARPRRVLIFYRTEGYVHQSIPVANEAFKQLGERTGAYTADISDDMDVFQPKRLQRYDAILFNNTTRLAFADPTHRRALLSFVEGGKGLIGIHAASDNFYCWPEAQALLGGRFRDHPWNAPDTVFVKLDDPSHPLVASFEGQGFSVRDEIYRITGPYGRDRQRVLLSLDMSRAENARPAQGITGEDGDFPIAWLKRQGSGRVFYSSLGHNAEIYSNRPILQHYLDGIQFAIGDLKADVSPSLPQRAGASSGGNARENCGWPAYHGGFDNNHYSSLTQINRHNVKHLKVAWTLDTGDHLPNSELEVNPIVIDGVIYVISPKLNLIAADAATGKTRWRFDPFDGKRVLGRYRSRGVSYWSAGTESRLFFAARHSLYALDVRTGKPVPTFGKGGHIDLREHLDRDPAKQSVSLNTPGVVYQDLLIVGSAVNELLPAAYGDIRAYDVRTGKLRWKFHTIPRPGEFGHETWPKDAWKHTGGANSWAGLSLDAQRGIVYAPTGSASFDYYGGDRTGDNLFANTLLALDAKTGKRLWHFQFVHHDTWDRDLPTAPSLVTVTRNGKRIDAVAQPTKSGHVFVFDRVSGEPLFPIEERKVSTSGGVPGEVLSPTQPFPLKPAPFARQVFTEDLITQRTSEAHAAVLAKFKAMKSGGPFIPLSEAGTIVLPGLDGGAEWGGAAWDPETGQLYVNATDEPWFVRLAEREPSSPQTSGRGIYLRECSACHGADRKGAPGYPSLIGLGEHYTLLDIMSFVAFGSGRMPGFISRLNWESLQAVAEYVTVGQDTAVTTNTGQTPLPHELKYTLAEIGKFQDPDGYPGVKPPWGTLNAINLNTGDHAWQIPLGEYPALAAQGMKNTGSENMGGPVVTAGGLLFIGATVYDKKFRAFDKHTGELLWETTLPAAAHATPAVYEANGRQFVVIAAGGGKSKLFSTAATGSADDSGATYIAFALPEKSTENSERRRSQASNGRASQRGQQSIEEK